MHAVAFPYRGIGAEVSLRVGGARQRAGPGDSAVGLGRSRAGKRRRARQIAQTASITEPQTSDGDQASRRVEMKRPSQDERPVSKRVAQAEQGEQNQSRGGQGAERGRSRDKEKKGRGSPVPRGCRET